MSKMEKLRSGGKTRVLLMLFLPFILNFAISILLGFSVAMKVLAEGRPREEIGFEVTKIIFTHNYYWSIIQVTVGLYAIKIMGGFEKVKKVYSKDDLLARPSLSIALIAGLTILSLGLIFLEQVILAQFYRGWAAYMEHWKQIVSVLPWWSRMYFVCIAPFTAGIFEEIIWRWFGISSLESFTDTKKAVVIQALAFGIWHGLSLHAVITFLIGLVYGYFFVKRRKLLALSIAHILTDIIGFGWAFLAS